MMRDCEHCKRHTPDGCSSWDCEFERRESIYIAGPITGRTDYEEKFNDAETFLASMGYEVLNPIKEGLVDGYEYRDYINRGFGKLMRADAIFMLPGWEDSPGARLERMYAEICGLKVTRGSEA